MGKADYCPKPLDEWPGTFWQNNKKSRSLRENNGAEGPG